MQSSLTDDSPPPFLAPCMFSFDLCLGPLVLTQLYVCLFLMAYHFTKCGFVGTLHHTAVNCSFSCTSESFILTENSHLLCFRKLLMIKDDCPAS